MLGPSAFFHGRLARRGSMTLAAGVSAAMVAVALGAAPVAATPPAAATSTPSTTASTDTTFAAGSYIIDMGAWVVPGGASQLKPNALKPYGLLFDLLVNRQVPVSWVIKDGKPGGYPPPATGLPLPPPADFSTTVQVNRAGAPVSKTYRTGALVIPEEFVDAGVNAALAAFPLVVVDKATTSFSAPVYKRLTYWPKAVLDAQNGKIAAEYYTNAGIPAGPRSYIFKAPSQLNACDDLYVMPHADPTLATHQNLIPWNAQGGSIWAGCHAVSVLENLPGMNFLSKTGLVPYGSHSDGSPPYSYLADGSDPVMQFWGPLDAATQGGSEQVYLPKQGGGWRPTTKLIAFDTTQADIPSKSPGPAGVALYGPAFGNPNYGLVMYEGGHSLNKGTVGDTAAQRAFFDYVMLTGTINDRAPTATIAPLASSDIGSGLPVQLSATISGGSPAYKYTWSSTCGGTFSTTSGTTGSNPATITTTFTAPSVGSATDCQVKLVVTDSCDRQSFDAVGFSVVSIADVAITKSASPTSVAPDGTITYTLTVTNNGPGTAAGVKVADTLPAELTFVSSTPAPTSTTAGTYAWDLGSLLNAGTSTITVTATAPSTTGEVVNTATVSSDTLDPNPDNNTSTATVHVVNTGISITKVARPEMVPAAGGTVTYEFAVTNTGDGPLSDVTVVDNPTCTISGPTGDLNGNGLLDPAYDGFETEVWRYTCTAVVNASTPSVSENGAPPVSSDPYVKQDVVTVTAKDATGATITSAGWTSVTVAHPSVDVTKDPAPSNQIVAPGGTATFRITVTNSGNVPLVSTSTTDPWAGDCAVASIPTLAPGESYSYLCSATVPSTATASDVFADPIATAWSGGTGWSSNWVDSQDTSPTAGDIRVVAASGISPTAPPAGYSTPNVISYEGNKRTLARSVDLSGTTSALVRFIYWRSAAFNNSDRDFNVYASNGGSKTLMATVTPAGINGADSGWTTVSFPMPLSMLTAGATITFGDTNVDLSNRFIYLDNVEVFVGQSNTVNVSATDIMGTTVTDTDTGSVDVGLPSLSITKTSSVPGPLRDGDSFEYTIEVTNNGSAAATGITVADTLPTGLSLDGTVTADRPNNVTATDTFGTGTSFATGTGWADASWTKGGTGDANKMTVVNNKGLPASAARWDPANNTTLSLSRTVDSSNGTGGTLTFSCSRESGTWGGVVDVYLGGVKLGTINSSTAAGECGTGDGSNAASDWGTTSYTLPAAPSGVYANPATLEFRYVQGANNSRRFFVDNVDLRVTRTAVTVNAGDPPTLTSAGGPYTAAPGEKVTFHVPVKVTGTPDDGMEFSNLAGVTSDQQTTPTSGGKTLRYLSPSFSITKVASPLWINVSGTVTYTVEVVNTGNSDLTMDSISDPDCDAPLTGPTGDINSDGILQVDEVWGYTCTRDVTTPSTPPDPDVVPNTVTATMNDTTGAPVGPETASADVRVIHPSIELTVTPPSATILNSGTVSYTYTLKNTGDVSILDPSVTAANCTPVVYDSGDTNNDGILDVDETWTYSCTTGDITADQTDQAVDASGKDPIYGSTVTDSKKVNVTVIDPAISVVKTARDGTGTPADEITVGPVNAITYEYAVTNTGDIGLAPVTAIDDTCSPVTYVSGDTTGAGVLDPAETWLYECVETSPLTSTTTNTIQVEGGYSSGGLTGSVTATDTAKVIVKAPFLVLTKEPSSEYVRTGSSVTYTYGVTNTGETSFALADLGAVTDDKCSPLVGPTWVIDSGSDTVLNPGDEIEYTCTTTIVTDTLNTFTMGQSTDDQGTKYTPDPATAQVFAIDPNFTVTKLAETSIDGPGDDIIGIAGSSVDYKVLVAHTITTPYTGDQQFKNALNAISITVTDDVCPNMVLTSGDNGSGLLTPGETWVYTCTLAALPEGPATVNTVEVTGTFPARETDPNGDPIDPNDGLEPVTHTDTATVKPGDPAIEVIKDASPSTYDAVGDVISYTFAVTNTGEVALTGVEVTDPELDTSVTCPRTELDPGDGMLCTGSRTIRQSDIDGGSVVNTATAKGTPPSGPDVTDQSTNTVTGPDRQPGLSIAKTSLTDNFQAEGDEISYSFVVTNTGNVTVTGVAVVDDTLDAPAVCVDSALAPGEATTCVGTHTVTAADMTAGKVVNIATAEGTPPPGTVLPPVVPSKVIVPKADPSLRLVKEADVTAFDAVGDVINYTITVTNNGNVALTNVTVTDPLLTLTCNPVTPTSLAVAGTITCTGSHSITQADIDRGYLDNTATVTGKDPGNNDVTDTGSTRVLGPEADPTLTIVKSTTATGFSSAGDVLPYSFVVTNTGNVTITNVEVIDPMLDGPADCPLTTLAPGESTTCTGSHTTTQSELDAGGVTNIASASGTPERGVLPKPTPSTVTVPADLSPELTVVKSASPTTFAAVGDTLTYSFVVTNSGNVTLTDVTVSDPLLDTPVTCPVTRLEVGDSMTCSGLLYVTQDEFDAGKVVNTATAKGITPSGGEVTDDDTATVNGPTRGPSMSITKTSTTSHYRAVGDEIDYTFVITNTGNVTLTDVGVDDAQLDEPATCADTTLPPGGSTTCVGVHTVTADDITAGSVVNSATPTATPPPGTVIPPTPPATVTVPKAEPTLEVLKTASVERFTAVGQTIVFTITATNTGNVALTNVTVTDPMLTDLTCDPTTPIASLPAGDTVTCTGLYEITQADVDAGVITNTATAEGSDGGTKLTETDKAQVIGPEADPSVTILKSAVTSSYDAAGQTVDYEFLVTNTGNVGLTGVSVRDPLLSSGPTCPKTALEPQEAMTCTGSVTVTQADVDRGEIENVASVAATPKRGSLPEPDDSKAIVPADPKPAISVAKSASPTTFGKAGDTVSYTITVTNTGNQTLSNIVVSDPLLDADPSCPKDTLVVNEAMECTGTITVTQADVDRGSIENTAKARGTSPSGTPVEGTGKTTVNGPTRSPSMTIVKSSLTPHYHAAGDTIDYKFVVTNTGNVTITGVAVVDNRVDGGTVFCASTTLAPGASTNCFGSYTVTAADVTAGQVDNSATATGTPPPGTVLPPVPPSEITVPLSEPGLQVVKVASPTTFTTVGSSIGYTITVTNNGNVPLTEVTVSDPLMTLTCTPTVPVAVLAVSGTISCTGSYTVKQSDVDHGSITNIATAEGLDPQGAKVTDTDTAVVTGPTANPMLTIVKTTTTTSFSKVGQKIPYSFRVTNTGNVTVSSITIVDSKLDAAASCPSTTLAPSAFTTCTGQHTVTQADINTGKVVNSATVTGTPARGTLPPVPSSKVTVPSAASADLSIIKSSVGRVYVLGRIAFTMTVRNNGTSSAASVVVRDTLPSSLRYVSSGGTGWTCSVSGQAVTCRLSGSLAVGATSIVRITAKATTATLPSIVNTATVTSVTPDPNPSNNTSSKSLAVLRRPQPPAQPIKATVTPGQMVLAVGKTVAGQKIRVRILCVPSGINTAADRRFCKVTLLPDGRWLVRSTYPTPIRVRVEFSAPGTAAYLPYREVRTYTVPPVPTTSPRR